ncbi:hypothetical protein PVAP13_3KG227318 [Panicum virgatum]|uniref:Uncharacterized protein n=1 Tax=Panicum virgatum TaxID=38727 RepID=A0A8T0V4W0_PANVG|nr:hypothetical protein PVAP13_3KG227318 [Panicum virgatum]
MAMRLGTRTLTPQIHEASKPRRVCLCLVSSFLVRQRRLPVVVLGLGHRVVVLHPASSRLPNCDAPDRDLMQLLSAFSFLQPLRC